MDNGGTLDTAKQLSFSTWRIIWRPVGPNRPSVWGISSPRNGQPDGYTGSVAMLRPVNEFSTPEFDVHEYSPAQRSLQHSIAALGSQLVWP